MNKILYLPTRYFPAISGAEFYLQRIIEITNKNLNYEVDVFTSNALDFKALRENNGKVISVTNKFHGLVNNIKINRFPINYGLSMEEKANLVKRIPSYNRINLSKETLNSFLNNGPFMNDLLYRIENAFSHDLVHTTFFPYFNLVVSLLIGKTYDIPTICTPFFHFANPRYLDKDLVKILGNFDIIISCTNQEKEFLVSRYKIPAKKIRVIPMGVDVQKFNCNSKLNFKKKYFRSSEKKYKMVLFCGYKNFEKGAISILKAIPKINQYIKKVYFVFIGPSTQAYNREFSKVQKLENTRIINLTPNNLSGYFDPKKISAFKETDVYLMPSRSDAFGIAFLEAWASGKPVIGANIGATPEVIKNKIDGLLVEFDNPTDIAEKVITLLRHKGIRKTYGKNGQSKVLKSHTWDIIAKKTHMIYQELLENPK